MHPVTVSATWPSAPQAVIATVAVAKVEKLVNPPSTPLPQKNPDCSYPNRAEPTKFINSKGQISACGHAAAAVREPSPTLRPQRAKAPKTAPAPTMSASFMLAILNPVDADSLQRRTRQGILVGDELLLRSNHGA